MFGAEYDRPTSVLSISNPVELELRFCEKLGWLTLCSEVESIVSAADSWNENDFHPRYSVLLVMKNHHCLNTMKHLNKESTFYQRTEDSLVGGTISCYASIMLPDGSMASNMAVHTLSILHHCPHTSERFPDYRYLTATSQPMCYSCLWQVSWLSANKRKHFTTAYFACVYIYHIVIMNETDNVKPSSTKHATFFHPQIMVMPVSSSQPFQT